MPLSNAELQEFNRLRLKLVAKLQAIPVISIKKITEKVGRNLSWRSPQDQNQYMVLVKKMQNMGGIARLSPEEQQVFCDLTGITIQERQELEAFDAKLEGALQSLGSREEEKVFRALVAKNDVDSAITAERKKFATINWLEVIKNAKSGLLALLSNPFGGFSVLGVVALEVFFPPFIPLIPPFALAVWGVLYALKKVGKSFYNIVTLRYEKMPSSIFRIGATATATILGVMKGAALGALLGSAVPIIGTAAGAIIGAVIGGGVFAGLGTYLAKKLNQFVAWAWNKSDYTTISRTNPNKYRLSPERESALHAKGFNVPFILAMLRAQKNNPLPNEAMVRNTEVADRGDYNQLLAELKKDTTDLSKEIMVGADGWGRRKVYFRWEGTKDAGLWKSRYVAQGEPSLPISAAPQPAV